MKTEITLEELYPHIIYESAHYDVPLKGFQKFKELARKRWFEICVGTYWSRDRKVRNYHLRRPKWLNSLLSSLFYRTRGLW